MADDSSPLNMGTSWDALSGPAATDSGYDPRFGQQLQGALPAPQLAGQGETDRALANMRDMQSRLAVQHQQNEQVLPPSSAKFNKDGTVDLKGLPMQTYEAYNRDRQQLNEIRGAFHQQAEHLAAQEQQARNQPPWVQLATALSANIAQAKNMPGWVQALGKTAAELNPRPEQIAARRLGVLGEEAKLAERAGGMELEVAREARLSQESVLRERTAFEKENVGAVIRGEGDPAGTTALAVQRGFVKPEQADAYQKHLEAMQASYGEKKDADEKRTVTRQIQLELVKAGVASQKRQEDFVQQDKIVGARIAATAAENDKKLAAAAAKGAAKKTELEQFEVKELEQYAAADKALDEVEALLKTKKAQEIMGPISGTTARITAKWMPKLADPDGAIAGMDSKLKLQTAQAIKSTGAGARGFGPQERPFFEGLAEGLTRSPEQNQKIIDTWRQYLDQSRRGVLVNHTDETLQKYPKMFGSRLAGPTQAAPTSNDPLGVR